ncbi:7,8-didemethyl-8-hydroxy-5-deazariboflavin synthase subunit CofG [Natrinema sp. 1APR25-10V2]|uniref:7,8-didemethyl-8-hydroxy-5-deazariboflavin synthase subunit CofG n=1 Tax=Natrinema sp. 1APR25-10V2 TaxID=2951081 RepID=UPI00287606C5|nr:7,8-didemethyl-8-hydroxy-5-deazariboflavin synthase subunit CofG [Natrinema sp. 1APR25-10V2]MDS0477249.1 7,8-didemethyl-8-hydroxy-5-deazariboflavin synthase subunit CofG [Natrinema sp. 1APR25-10V2]
MDTENDPSGSRLRFGGDAICISESEIDDLLTVSPDDVTTPKTLTVAKNVFLPVTTACRYTCTYCTFFDPPGEASVLSMDEIRAILRQGVEAGCTEALFTFGDKPDDRYTGIHRQLEEWGYGSIHEYLHRACEVALEEGILPHSNPGDLTYEEMEYLSSVNASMGVMLETTATVDAHAGKRRKTPEQRLRTIRAAGELAVPFTTGILVGLGESWRDRAESILAIKALHERYGHIQEVIVQNVVPNERSEFESPSVETMRRVTAMARYGLPDTIELQVPPNLFPVDELLDCGIGDFGGVSPITADHINPDYAWPELQRLEELADGAEKDVVERLPVYERYLDEETAIDGPQRPDRPWVAESVQETISSNDHLARLTSTVDSLP